jgi:glycosyltransferase involved in cell wall biosynthesis
VIEAMAEGLPCVVHDSAVMRFAVGEHGTLTDMTKRGALSRVLPQATARRLESGEAGARHRHVYERFSWERLRARYARLFRDVARGDAAKRTVSSSTGENVWR